MIENYLLILEDSLQKKLAVLEEIQSYNREQEKLLKKEPLSYEELDANMEQKDALIAKLTGLDEGFESLYEKIRSQLMGNRQAYAAQIKRLQGLITQVTDLSVSVQAQEARNKQAIERYFAREKEQLRQGRKASRAAYGYYKSMSGAAAASSQFLDQKK